MENKTVGKILGNVAVKALADTSPDTLSQLVPKTIPDTLTCMPLLNTLHCSLAQVEAKLLVSGVTLTENQQRIEAETLNIIPGQLKAKALLDALAGTLGDIKADNFFRYSG